jgi:probable F420-dependent oxidoreductase
MRFDSMLEPTLDGVGDAVDRAVASGRDGGWVIETAHDPFLLLATAAAKHAPLGLGTAVAVAFARTPMLLAVLGNDLQQASGGKFILGLGSQVRPHIERRFSMPWGKPVGRMREMIRAIHAIWDSWENDTELDFRGEYYTHTLMTPVFNPGSNEFGRPPIYLGALGPAMTELAGEIADGIVIHRFMTERFLREVTLPSIKRGLEKRYRPLTVPFQVVYPPFVAAADSDEEMSEQIADLRSHIAFYASTPGYRTLLDLHGWSEIGEQLSILSRQGKWDRMPALVTDDMVEHFAVITQPGRVEEDLVKRFDGAVDHMILYPPL